MNRQARIERNLLNGDLTGYNFHLQDVASGGQLTRELHERAMQSNAESWAILNAIHDTTAYKNAVRAIRLQSEILGDVETEWEKIERRNSLKNEEMAEA